jgi:hypothetical protein
MPGSPVFNGLATRAGSEQKICSVFAPNKESNRTTAIAALSLESTLSREGQMMRKQSKRRSKKRVVKTNGEREGKRLTIDFVRREISSVLRRISASKKQAKTYLSGVEQIERDALRAKQRFETTFGRSKKKSVGR